MAAGGHRSAPCSAAETRQSDLRQPSKTLWLPALEAGSEWDRELPALAGQLPSPEAQSLPGRGGACTDRSDGLPCPGPLLLALAQTANGER